MKLNVEGMTCGHCQRAIERAINALGGSARVDLATGTVDIEGIADAAAVRSAIEDEGYRVVDRAPATASGSCSTSRTA
jgi:copper chaperone